MRKITALSVACGCIVLVALASFANILPKNFASFLGQSNLNPNQNIISISEGPPIVVSVTAGPFDIHRKYRSMEGPYISEFIRIGDLVASKNINLPEGFVKYVEGGAGPAMMNGGGNISQATKTDGIVDTSKEPPQLYWLKGIKLEVLDEHDNLLPTAEFICHFNLDVDHDFRNKVFPYGEPCLNGRLVSITQGQTVMSFPKGYAVPVASNEIWQMTFQAANRTTLEHRRLKHRCTYYFVKDSALVYPVTALEWAVPFMRVVIDGNVKAASDKDKLQCPACLGFTAGVNAPINTVKETDPLGRHFSGHWIIPPGLHTYTSQVSVTDPYLASKDRVLHAIWSHLHPLATTFTLYKCQDDSRQPIFQVHEQTKTEPGLEIQHIDYISSEAGILMPGLVPYELEVTYDNTTGEPQDSMATTGLFFENPMFVRPDWVYAAHPGVVSCMPNGKCK